MIAARLVLAPAALALAACAADAPPASQAAEPAPEPQAPAAPATTVSDEGDGVLRVSGLTPNEDELAALHCAAAKRARADGAVSLEWVGGIAKRLDKGYAADLVYETGAAAVPAIANPADGGAAPVENWLTYCDEAGVPREGEA